MKRMVNVSFTPLSDDITRYRFFKQLCALPFIEAIYLYGSRARGTGGEWADVDLAISADAMTECGWRDVLRIAETADILVPVEVVWLEQVKDGVLRQEIERDKTLLWQRRIQ